MSTTSRPVFYEGQILTAEDLNSISAYCASKVDRLRILSVTATLISWAAAVVAMFAIWMHKRG